MASGSSSIGSSGTVTVSTGSGAGGAGGSVSLTVGGGDSGAGGNACMTAGASTAAGAAGGSVCVRAGAGCGSGSTATMAGDAVSIEATSEKLSLSGGGGADGGVSVSGVEIDQYAEGECCSVRRG